MERVEQLVKEQYQEMNLENKKVAWDLKQIALSNKCQNIIYTKWGISNQSLWDEIDNQVEKLIPNQYD